MKKRIPALLAALMLVLSSVILPAYAEDDEAFNGLAADTLTVKVGYFGGPYYEKKVFSLEELWALDVVYADYTFIDNMPSVVIDHVAGVRLSDLLAASGIDLNSVRTFYFWTRDKQSDYYTSYTKEALIDTPRYCYYSLPDNWDDEAGMGNELATSYAEPVDTLIGLADDWNRCIAGATFGSDYANLNTNTRFRLIFGQTNSWERTASRSAKWIHEIVVELGGAPTLTLDDSVLEGEVGSVLRTQASPAADSAVLENESVTWSSSDESIATVDSEGNIKIVGEGTATITATFAGVSASLSVTGKPGSSPSNGGNTGENNGGNTGGNTGGNAGTDKPADPSTNPNTNSGKTHVTTKPTDQKPSSQKPETDGQETGGETQLVEPEVKTDNQTGGVQNWRVFEMSDTAAELGNIEPDQGALGAAGIGAISLLTGSGAAYAIGFYVKLRRDRS